MPTQYQNQSAQYSDLNGNTATITPDIGFVIQTPLKTIVVNVDGFTNGVESLLFTDIYATVEKTRSVKFDTSTPTKLSLVDTIEIQDDDTVPTKTTNITSTEITIIDTFTLAEATYGINGIGINNGVGYLFNADSSILSFTAGIGTEQSSLTASTLTLTDGTTTNTLNKNNWSGNIQTVNTAANITHYLNFSDSSGTGYGKPQKTAGISCNPSTNTITATTFSGNATSSSTATGVNLTSDNTLGTYFLPFSKTSTATGNLLFVDNTTTPLTYVPSTSTLTATNFSGTATNANNLVMASDNTPGSYYIPFSKTSAGTNPLYVDDFTSPLTYNPSSGLMSALFFSGDAILPLSQNTATFAGTTLSFSGASNLTAVSCRNASIVITGGSNTIAALTITNTLVNGKYKIGILNNGSGNLTINTGLGTNIKTIYSGGFNVSSGRYAQMTITVIIINAVTTYIVNAAQLTN